MRCFPGNAVGTVPFRCVIRSMPAFAKRSRKTELRRKAFQDGSRQAAPFGFNDQNRPAHRESPNSDENTFNLKGLSITTMVPVQRPSSAGSAVHTMGCR